MKVVSFYRFIDVVDTETMRNELQVLCEERGLLGTILVADEGVNGTLAGSTEAIQAVFDFLRNKLALSDAIVGRWTEAGEAPFRRIRVKIKNEIVTLGRADIKPHKSTGKHVSPEEWNRLIADPKTLDFARYRGVQLLMPNTTEIRAATGMPCETDQEVVDAARSAVDKAGIDNILVTRSKRGMTLVPADGEPD